MKVGIQSPEEMVREAAAMVPYFASRGIGLEHAVATIALFLDHERRTSLGGQFPMEQAASFARMLNEAIFGKGQA